MKFCSYVFVLEICNRHIINDCVPVAVLHCTCCGRGRLELQAFLV